ncbi:isoform 4 of fibroblast growth factor receptor 1-A [Fusarium albosuccineum]|uniref:Isoform 4 of fibroblast growth factor receptor 1-A n=1 Tax=Fusarium albosuccineum TaxID=1237068 RepID=A0A8H4LPP0_9HYPO|nr:isoform 4 of fibroblast growth factor receptor 1-A [Fusarium albosuccineum]
MAELEAVSRVLSTVGFGTELINLPNILTSIASSVQAISEQRQSGKKKCTELLLDAITLTDIIENPNTNCTEIPVEKLKNLILEIQNCVDGFAKKDLVGDIAEATFKGQYSQLRDEYRHWEGRYILFSIWRKLRKVLETTRAPPSKHSPVNLMIETSSITWQGSIGRGRLASLGDVECRRLDVGFSSRHALQLYQDFQRGAHVQIIHGIAEINNQYYVVMQDCSEFTTLKSWRGDASRGLTLSARARIAYDVAQSVAWFHEGGLLVKFLTESYVRLKNSQNSRQQPILTQLQYARHLYEKTDSVRIDVRYEAPEILTELLEPDGNSKPHSHATDVWSLGIVIWQILTDGSPYQLEDDMYLHKPKEEIAALKRRLEVSSRPGEFPSDLPSSLVEIIQNCWSPLGQGRPSAKAVAGSLLRTQALLDSAVNYPIQDGVDSPVSPYSLQELDQARSTAWALIQGARKRSEQQHEQNSQLGEGFVEVLLHYAKDLSHPECAFLIGGLIWWELVNPWWIQDSFTPRSLGCIGMLAGTLTPPATAFE